MTDVDDVLDPVEVRGEEPDQDPPSGPRDEALQRLGHHPLGRGLALDLGIGRVAQEAQHLAVRQRLQPGQVGGAGVERRVVQLEVTGVDDGALGRAQEQAHRVGDGVRHPERLDLERRRGAERLAGEDLPQIGADVHLLQALGDQGQGEPGPVDRHAALAEQERQGAHVVLVRVGEQHGPELGGGVPEVAEVGDDQLHPGKLGGREEQARVHQQQLVLTLEDHRVQADLTQSAERDDPQHASTLVSRPAARARGERLRSL